MKYLSPRTEVCFKKLFGNKHHKTLTIDFLNCILDLKERNLIETVKFADTEQLPKIIEGRKSFFHIIKMIINLLSKCSININHILWFVRNITRGWLYIDR